jgi:hypothetical protein
MLIVGIADDCLAEHHVDRALRQFLAKTALIEFRHQRAFEFVALVEERQPEREPSVVTIDQRSICAWLICWVP